MIIIGITGTIGAGKGTAVEYLTGKKGFLHFTVRGFLSRILEKKGIPVNRNSLYALANELRASHSPSYIVDRLFDEALLHEKDCIIESIRTPGEILSLKEKGDFYLLAMDADPKIRYERIRQRGSETDRVSWETFVANEQREMEQSDPSQQNLKKCIEMADFLISNNGSKAELHHKIETLLQVINQRNNDRKNEK